MNNANRLSAAIMLLVAILLTVVYKLTTVGPFQAATFDIMMVLLVIAVAVFMRNSQHSSLKGYWLKPSNLFIIAYLAVNFQFLADYRVGFKNEMSRHILFPECLNLCLILGMVGLFAFVAGYSWVSRDPFYGKQQKAKSLSLERLRFPLVALQLLMFIGFILTIDVVSYINGMDYGNENKTNSTFEGTLYVANALIVLYVANRDRDFRSLKDYLHSFPWLSLVVIGIYMVLRLLSGDRGPFVYTAILLFYGYAYASRKKYKLITVATVVIVAAVAMSIVGIARTLDRGEGFFSRVLDAREMFREGGRFANDESSIMPATEELGFSFIVNQVDVEQVENRGVAYNHGAYTLYSVISGIPFGPRLITQTMGVRPEEFSSSGFANYHYFGGYERNWGVGTTIVGDFYLQFGVFGVLIGLFVAGLFLSWIDWVLFVRNKNSIGVYLLLFALLFASKEIYMPRSMLLNEWPRFVHGAIILFMLLMFTGSKARS